MGTNSESYIEAYLATVTDRGRSPETVGTYRGILRHMDRELPAGLVNANGHELLAWIGAEHRSPATQQLYRAVTLAFFAHATSPSPARAG
ncbi:MAG TPA: hypothetical protein VFM37_01425 [Pseudonocardiaceae bacterium]|nr:hypothetical protein [Pseudonocardiaceae bacterium]